MAEAFKLLLNAARIQVAAAQLQRHERRFDAAGFVARATQGLDALEFKARAGHVADALQATLPPRFADAAALLQAAMATPTEPGQPWADDGLSGWILWPVGEYVARHGQHDLPRALATLHALTQRFTAEFAIRPFIAQQPKPVFETLARWTTDPSAHVRRLVSEGSRPRLPWGERLRALVADPSPTLPLLRALQDDDSEYVRRSVANHLNDIAKDHPALVVQWLRDHLPDAATERRALLRHASRTLVKAGDAGALAAWGLDRPFRGTLDFGVAPRRVTLGGSLTLTLVLRSTQRQPQRLVIDYAVHHVKADGGTRPKVFKGWVIELAGKGERTLTKTHPMRAVTVRRYHAGRHAVDLRINGRVWAESAFDLRLPRET
ncbi:MAG: DNA alkylation repair protein [Rubrivivax sp.]